MPSRTQMVGERFGRLEVLTDREAAPVEPSEETRKWIISQQIRFAKSKKGQAA